MRQLLLYLISIYIFSSCTKKAEPKLEAKEIYFFEYYWPLTEYLSDSNLVAGFSETRPDVEFYINQYVKLDENYNIETAFREYKYGAFKSTDIILESEIKNKINNIIKNYKSDTNITVPNGPSSYSGEYYGILIYDNDKNYRYITTPSFIPSEALRVIKKVLPIKEFYFRKNEELNLKTNLTLDFIKNKMSKKAKFYETLPPPSLPPPPPPRKSSKELNNHEFEVDTIH